MPSINMIAVRRAEKLRMGKLTRILLLLIIGEVAIGLLLFSFMTARVYSANRTIGELDQKLKKVQPTVDKILYYENQIKSLTPRLDLLADSKEQTLFWYTILQNLSQSMPAQTWLGSLSTNQISTGSGKDVKVSTTLNLRGTSISQRLVGETMLRLNQFPEFEKVDLNYTQGGAIEKSNTVDFEMAIRLKSNELKKGGGDSNAAN